MNPFRKPTVTQQIQISLQVARQRLLEVRVLANQYTNEVAYQEGLIKLLEAQLEDQIITASDGTTNPSIDWVSRAKAIGVRT